MGEAQKQPAAGDAHSGRIAVMGCQAGQRASGPSQGNVARVGGLHGRHATLRPSQKDTLHGTRMKAESPSDLTI